MLWKESSADTRGDGIGQNELVEVPLDPIKTPNKDAWGNSVMEDQQGAKKTHTLDAYPSLPEPKALESTFKAGNGVHIREVQAELEDSAFEEVRAAVRNTDDGSVANTVRAWILGMLFVTVVAAVNMFLSMRSPAISVPVVVVILIVYPIGELWARIVPMRKFRTFGIEWTFNPGPWTIKEHTVVTLMANVTTGYPYSTNALEALQARSLYNHNMGWGMTFIITRSNFS
jgi:OPT oligopeptide transporter protein